MCVLVDVCLWRERAGGMAALSRRGGGSLIQQEVPLGPRRHLRFEKIVCGERAAIRGIIRWRVRRDASATESVPLEYKRFDASRATRVVCECAFGESELWRELLCILCRGG